MKILITGAAGFIGSNLCEWLLVRGHKIFAIDNLSTGNIKNLNWCLLEHSHSFFFDRIDLLDEARFYQYIKDIGEIDAIVHLAATGSVPRSVKYPKLTLKNNIDGTQAVLNAMLENKIKKIIFASSSSVYGKDRSLVKKEHKTNKILSPYAYSKKINENQIKIYSDYVGYDYYILRFFNVFGKNQNPNGPYSAVIPKWANLMKKNQDIEIYGDGKISRDFTHVYNVCSFIESCLNKEQKALASNDIYNVGCGAITTLNELFNLLAENFNYKKEPIYLDEREGDVKSSQASIQKAWDFLKYKPILNFRNGLKLYSNELKRSKT